MYTLISPDQVQDIPENVSLLWQMYQVQITPPLVPFHAPNVDLFFLTSSQRLLIKIRFGGGNSILYSQIGVNGTDEQVFCMYSLL